MSVVIKVENLSKYYRLGVIGGGTLREDLGRWWAINRGKPDPLLKIGEDDHGNRKDGQIWALRDVSFDVQEGEILGIIGRNGAGKSTLLKILSRITSPTSGRALMMGRVGSLLEVGTGFHPELTGRENIYLNGSILGMTRREVTGRLAEIVEFAEMSQFIDTPVKRYSSGMKVRLAFAVAAHLEPETLIIDEVLAVGDAAFQKKCIGKMSEVAQRGRTILFVSHNMTSIQMLCTSGIVLSDGRVSYKGSASETVNHYLNLTKSSYIPISKRTDRIGSKEITIQAINILADGCKLAHKDLMRTGDRIEFEVVIESKRMVRGPVDVDIGVNDRKENRLFWMSTHLLDSSLYDLEKGKHVFSFEIPKLPLTPGSYSLTSCVRIGTETSDWVKDSILFEVAHGKFFEVSAENLDPKSSMLVDYKVNKRLHSLSD